ncbi:hypothetical protein DITRI_Ditri03aG0225400 [Diplodiscus trichospermus]
MEKSEIQPEYRSISCELQGLARMVKDQFGNGETENAGFGETTLSTNSTHLFERGRFYNEYSVRRNEKLKRKKGERGNESNTGHNLGVTIESSKRRDSKKLESLRKSVCTAYSAERSETQTPRYMLRSMSNENKKPPLAVNNYVGTEKKVAARRVRSI